MNRHLNLSLLLASALLTLPAVALAKTYHALKDESRISYHLHHPMHEIEGISKDFDCTVELDNDTAHSQIHVKASVASFNSGNSNRDSHALEILQAFKHPFVEFISDSVRHEEKGYRVFGQLTFHGIQRVINFIVIPAYLKDRVHITGSFTVMLSDYGVKRPTLMFIPTADELRIDLDVMALGP